MALKYVTSIQPAGVALYVEEATPSVPTDSDPVIGSIAVVVVAGSVRTYIKTTAFVWDDNGSLTPYADRVAEARTPGTAAARHVEGERRRVERATACLDAGDARGVGRLMLECHASLRDLYRCSFPAADDLVARLAPTPGVLGARLVGAGCTVKLI